MKTASAGLIALLNGSRQFFIADLYTFTLGSGASLYYTSADVDLTFGGHVFSSMGPRLSRGSIKSEVGIKVATCAITIAADATQLIGGITWSQFAQQGGLDGAAVTIQRCYMPTWGDVSNGAVTSFSGRVSDVKPSRNTVEIDVRSDLELLNIQMPRRLYQASCTHALYDAGCRINKADVTGHAACRSGCTTSTLLLDNVSGLSLIAGYYELGSITMTSGANVGLSRTIKVSGALGIFLVIPPFPTAPAAADTCDLIPGCDKTMASCSSKFMNMPQFGGFPYVPVPETAL